MSLRIATNTTANRLSFLLELVELTSEVAMRRQELPEPDERAHDHDVHLNRAVTMQYARQHRDSLLCEYKRPIPPSAAPCV
jgi:hypothetical protein